MKLLALLPLAALAADVVVASAVPARHHRIARALNRKRRCLARPHNDTAPHSSSASPYPTTTTNDNTPPANFEQPPANYQHPSTPTTSPPANNPPANTPPADNPPAQHQSGTINVESNCGDIGATSDSTTTSGPNGSINWLNCGIQDGGWNPPKFTVKDVIAQDLAYVLQQPGNPFEPCQPHLQAFNDAANSYNVPAILLASIAMQESTCNPDVIGANGEQGLMQITPDKCDGGYASKDCLNPDFNVGAGAKYLRSTLDLNDNLPLAIGTYNGWRTGMTYDDATRARSEGHCFAQNNLDYLHQTLNGWMQGIDPHSRNMGVFFNLNGC